MNDEILSIFILSLTVITIFAAILRFVSIFI